jgi:hypothetical protein
MAKKIMNLQVAFNKSYRMFQPAHNLLAGLQQLGLFKKDVCA